MRRFFLLAITCLTFLSAASASIHAPTLIEQASFFGPSEMLVQKRVNALTGAQILLEVDGTLDSPDPLTLTRTYASFKRATGCPGWSINGYTRLYIQKKNSTKTSFQGDVECRSFDLVVEHFLGGTLHFDLYRDIKSPPKSRRETAKLSSYDAYASTFAGQASGQTHIGNYTITYDGETRGYILTTGDGSKLTYLPYMTCPCKNKGVEVYLLSERTFPSGNRCIYTYTSKGELEKIEVRNSNLSNLLNQATFSYSEDGSNIEVLLADKRKISYTFDPLGRLIQCKRADGFESRYIYEEESHLLIREQMPGGRYVDITYSVKENDHLQVSRLDRSCSFGNDEVLFQYSKEEDGLHTTISEPLKKIQCTYIYDSIFKLKEFQVFDTSSGAPVYYKSTRYFWEKAPKSSFLIAKTIHDANDKCLIGELYEHDQNGNVTKRTLCGALTGNPKAIVKLDTDGIPIPQIGEYTTSHYKYSTDGKNLIEISGSKTEELYHQKYTYESGTNLLTQKALVQIDEYGDGDEHQIEVFKYDENGALIGKLEGGIITGKSKGFLNKYENSMPWQPPTERSEINAEDSIDTLTKVSYDLEAKLQVESIFDPKTNTVAYTLTTQYDNAGRITYKTNAIGQEFKYRYNAYGELTYYLQPGFERHFTYDLSGNLTQIKTVYDNGEIEGVSYRHEAPGRCIEQIDSLGNSTKQSIDFLGRRTSVTYPTVLNESGQSVCPSVSFVYDPLGKVSKFIDARGCATDIRRNSYGKPSEITYPDGRKETFKYDPNGELYRHMAPDKLVRVFAHGPSGNLNKIEYSLAGERGKIKDLGSRLFTSLGTNLTEDSGAFSEGVSFKYDSSNNLVETQSKSKEKLTCYEYDGLKRLKTKKIYSERVNLLAPLFTTHMTL